MSNNNPVIENTATRVQIGQQALDPDSLREALLAAITTQDFDRIEALFAPQVRFRALVPSGFERGTLPQRQPPGCKIGLVKGSNCKYSNLRATRYLVACS